MTETNALGEEPAAKQIIHPRMNSIVATASTAHDLDTAHRKAAKMAWPFLHSTSHLGSNPAVTEGAIIGLGQTSPAKTLTRGSGTLIAQIKQHFFR
jgi:hypothetical protein